MLVEHNDCLMASVNKDLNKAVENNRSYWEQNREQEKEKLEKYLAKRGITKAEYDVQQEVKRIQAKRKRYEKEVIELENRLIYLKKWLAEHNI